MRTLPFFRRPQLVVPLSLLWVLGASGCDGPGAAGGATAATSATASASSPALGADVLVTVNGVPIRVSDLHYVLARDKQGRGPAGAEEADAVLDRLIEQEIARQKAEAMGLDRDPEYLRKLRFMEAPVNDFKRSELRKLYLEHKAKAEARVSEEEARAFFEKNRERFQTEVQIHKILVRGDEAKIQQMKAELDAGKPFEEVAAQQFPAGVPEGAPPPWDTGLLRWDQVPEPYVEAVAELEEGEVSDILRGPKQRAWIIKLVQRRLDEGITFESVEPKLMELLRQEKAMKLQQETLEALREEANVVRLRKPDAMPAPPESDPD